MAVAVLLPKCLLCVAGYLALGTGIMAAGPELCGAGEERAAFDGRTAMVGLLLAGLVWLFARPVGVRGRPGGSLSG